MRFAGRIAAVLVLAAMAAVAAPASTPPADPTVRRAADLVEWGRWQEARKLLAEAVAERAEGMNQFHALLVLPRMKKQLEKATALDPNSGDVQWAWIDLDLGLPAAAGGSTSEAMKHADRLSEIDPVDGRLARASIYESLKQT